MTIDCYKCGNSCCTDEKRKTTIQGLAVQQYLEVKEVVLCHNCGASLFDFLDGADEDEYPHDCNLDLRQS